MTKGVMGQWNSLPRGQPLQGVELTSTEVLLLVTFISFLISQQNSLVEMNPPLQEGRRPAQDPARNCPWNLTSTKAA